MAGSILYIAEVDYPKEHHEPHGVFADWYAHRHAPDLFKLGARTVSSYRPIVGGLAVLNVYEIPDPAVFKTPAYAAISSRDPYGTEVRGTSAGRRRAQTLYLQRIALPADDGYIDADWVSILRFAMPESEDVALIDWVSTDALRQLAPFGVKHIRLGTRIPETVGAGTFRPRCVIFAEWSAQPPEAAELLPALVRRFGARATEAELFVGSRIYPWPDVRRK